MGHSQILYAMAALAIVSILNLIGLRNSASTASGLLQNEVLSEVSGVATDILEDIGAHTFDARTDTAAYKYPPRQASQLTPPSGFGGDCDPFIDCRDIDDFHSKRFTVNESGVDFNVDVEVTYVDDDQPDLVVSSQTFSKAVTLTITSPTLFKSTPDSLLEIKTSRVFTYMRTGI